MHGLWWFGSIIMNTFLGIGTNFQSNDESLSLSSNICWEFSGILSGGRRRGMAGWIFLINFGTDFGIVRTVNFLSEWDCYNFLDVSMGQDCCSEERQEATPNTQSGRKGKDSENESSVSVVASQSAQSIVSDIGEDGKIPQIQQDVLNDMNKRDLSIGLMNICI